MVPSHSQTRQKLITQTLTLCNCTQTTVLNLLSVQLDRPVTKLESFLHESGQFPDSATPVAEDFLCVRGTDDDFCPCRRDADFTARVPLFGKFPGEEFVEFGEEDAVGDELLSTSGTAQTNECRLNAGGGSSKTSQMEKISSAAREQASVPFVSLKWGRVETCWYNRW